MDHHNAIVSRVDAGQGPLRVAVKDCIDIAGHSTRAGSRALANVAPAAANAHIIDRLLAAGCRIIGKANMHELAYGVTGINGWTGTPLNPLYPDLVPGGSSSGSASVVAQGHVDFAIGSDTGGSIRTPAACCGIFGMKPTFGRVNRQGAHPARSTLDVLGPLAPNISMIEKAMEIICPAYARQTDISPKIGVVRLDGEVDPRVADAFAAAMHSACEPSGEVELPTLQAAFHANIAVIAAETFSAFGDLLGTGLLGQDVAARLKAAGNVDRRRLVHAEEVRLQFRAEVDRALRGRHVLALPTMPVFPLSLEDAADAPAALRMTALVRPFNLSGHPALTIPVNNGRKFPVGIQLVGRIGEDETVLAAGRAIARRLAQVNSTGVSD